MIGLFDERAYKIARMRARRSFPARICGSLDIKPSTFSDPSIGLPNIPVCTLLLRSRSGYVETPLKFRGLVEYSESTVNPWDRFRGRAHDRRAHKGYDRARHAFPGCEVFRVGGAATVSEEKNLVTSPKPMGNGFGSPRYGFFVFFEECALHSETFADEVLDQLCSVFHYVQCNVNCRELGFKRTCARA